MEGGKSWKINIGSIGHKLLILFNIFILVPNIHMKMRMVVIQWNVIWTTPCLSMEEAAMGARAEKEANVLCSSHQLYTEPQRFPSLLQKTQQDGGYESGQIISMLGVLKREEFKSSPFGNTQWDSIWTTLGEYTCPFPPFRSFIIWFLKAIILNNLF